MQETKSVTDTVTLENKAILELLEGTITHAHKDKDLHSLNTVQLENAGGYLVARATDRYRLIEGKIEVEGNLAPSLISLEDTKRVIALVKGNKLSRVTLNRIGDLLTVSVTGSSITVQIIDANFPANFDELFTKNNKSVATDKASFNPAFMADYGKIAGKGKPVTVIFTGERMPMVIEVAGERVEWRALLMPMRVI
jgi:DNA polymerase III sliding clamp (beta) subunit (PCNA family)